MCNFMALCYVRCLRDPIMPQEQVMAALPSTSLRVNQWGLESAQVAFKPTWIMFITARLFLPAFQQDTVLCFSSSIPVYSSLPHCLLLCLNLPQSPVSFPFGLHCVCPLKKCLLFCGFNQHLHSHNHCLASSSLLASDLHFSFWLTFSNSHYIHQQRLLKQYVQNQELFLPLAKVILVSTGFFSQLTVTAYYSVHIGNVIKLLDPSLP